MTPTGPRLPGSPYAAAPKRAAIGFFTGVRSLFGGIGFIVTRPSAWGWAMIPVVFATILFAGFGALAIWGAGELATSLVDSTASGWHTAGAWLLRIVFSLIGLVVAMLVAMSLAQPASGFALDALSRQQELALGGTKWPDQPFVASTLRSLRVSFAALAMSLPVLALLAVITVVVPPAAVVTIPLKFIVAGLTAAYDFIDYPLSARGRGVRARLDFMRAHFWAVLGFGCAMAALLLVPFVSLLLLPFGVAGATRLVLEAERGERA